MQPGQISQRQLRVAENIRHGLCQIFLEKDFMAESLSYVSITITEVRVSPDLKNATAFTSTLPDDRKAQAVEVLNENAPKLRFMLGKLLKLRYTPKLYFKSDDIAEQAGKIHQLLDTVSTDKDS